MKLSLVASVASASVVEKAVLPLHSDWMRLADANGLENHEVTLAIKQLHIDALRKKLLDVSNPDSANEASTSHMLKLTPSHQTLRRWNLWRVSCWHMESNTE